MNICSLFYCILTYNDGVSLGRGGRRANETSTYKLFLKANSLVNQTAESSSKKRRLQYQSKFELNEGNKENKSSDGIDFTPRQLSMIAKLAHFDPLVGSEVERQSFPFDMLGKNLSLRKYTLHSIDYTLPYLSF